MSETAVTIIPHATLGDELRSVLRTDGGWLTRNSLLNRCELARDADQLEQWLARLFKEDLIQRRAGSVGLEYAALSTPMPKWEPRDARGPAAAAEALLNTRPPPPAPIAAIRQVNVQQRLDAVRAEMVELFQAKPLRSRSEFDAALGRSQPIVSRYLRAMREEGLIKTVGKGSTLKFQWLGEVKAPIEALPEEVPPNITPAAAHPETASPTLTASARDAASSVRKSTQKTTAAPPAATAKATPFKTRFGLFSDGALVIDRGDELFTLSQSDTYLLATFLASTGTKDMVFAP